MFTIRLAHTEDAADILAIYRPFIELTSVSFELNVPSMEEMKNRIRKTYPRYPWLVCTHQEKVIGYAYAGLHRKREAYQWTTEVSVYVHDDYRKKKIGSALYSALLDILKLQGFISILAGITIPNPGSISFHKAFGFEFFARYENVGYKFGNWHATEWYQISFLKGSQSPQKLIPITEITNSKDYNDIIEKAVMFIKKD
jgi:phosphinothricin acetyltransferase